MHSQTHETYYNTLGVDEDSAFPEIKQKYQTLIRTLHPDKNLSFGDKSKQRYHEIQNAWKVLSDETARQMYDEQIKRLRLESQMLINEEIELKDMEVVYGDSHSAKEYLHLCRCGGCYNLGASYVTMDLAYIILTCLVLKNYMEEIRALELYCGIGGMHFGLRESCPSAKVVAAVDINNFVTAVYAHNFPNVKVKNKGIEGISVKELNSFGFNMVLMSPPCQPFTRIGLQKDVGDKRTKSFMHFLSVLPDLKVIPQYLLLENVKGFEKSEAHRELCKTLDKCGYHKAEFLLTPKQLGIPNSRLRYFMLAKRRKFHDVLANEKGKLWTSLPLSQAQIWNKEALDTGEPQAKERKIDKREQDYEDFAPKSLHTFLVKDVSQEYTVPEKIKTRYINVMDVVTPDSTNSTCFTKSYTQYAEGTGSVLNVNPLTRISAKDNPSECNLRYFTPREVANIMCFPESFTFPDNVTKKQKYRMLGNSLNVRVVAYLISLLLLDEKGSDT